MWEGSRHATCQSVATIPMSSSASREAEGSRAMGPEGGGAADRLFLRSSFLL